MNLNLIFGGQFRPASGGQFQPALGGQFKSARGGQFHRFLQLYSRYFEDEVLINKIKYYLHVPLDSKVLKVLNNSKSFKALPTSLALMNEDIYYFIQEETKKIAQQNNCPRFYLDEYAWPN